MIIYLARHGQTTGDIENRYGGDYDDHLTQLGKQQANELADLLVGKNIKKLYSSPRKRAKETAGFVGSKLKKRVKKFKDFRERNAYGILSGLTKTEALEKYPDQVALLLKGVHYTVEGGEDYKAFQQRITVALEKLSHKSDEAVAIITHGGPIRLIFRDILKTGEIEMADCAYAAIEAKEGHYKLVGSEGIIIQGNTPVAKPVNETFRYSLQ